MRVIMYKWNRVMEGRWGWNLEKVWDEWNRVYSSPYYVEVPDDFKVYKSVTGEKMFFRNGCDIGYEICGTSSLEDCEPVLIGGSPVEIVKIKPIGPVE